jgi:predicted Abi (CAAX) family protease
MKTSNYVRYWEADFNRPDYYPIAQRPNPELYRPIGAWTGRLILPKLPERAHVSGCWIELSHAPDEHAALVGRTLRLRWEETPALNAALWGAARDVHFDQDSYEAAENGTVLAHRVDGLKDVNPFETFAAPHPYDDVIVRLDGQVRVAMQPADGGEPILFVTRVPIEISARFYALVQFVGPAEGDGYTVRHYDRASGDFGGPTEVVRLIEVVPNREDTRNSTAAGIERSPCNEVGWYIYGDCDAAGRFVVRALTPRQLVRLQPQLYCDSVKESMEYLKPKAWKQAALKGSATTALLAGEGLTPRAARASWQVGDRALLIHLFGGIGGNKTEPNARTPLFWGHFAFGEATVIAEPLSGEPTFDIIYHQVYVHNPHGLQAGALHYTRYTGDRQNGWLGVRPVQDMLIKLEGVTDDFTLWGNRLSPLDLIISSLEVMTARYRIADGRGGTTVGAANNCAQDSSQALFAAMHKASKLIAGRPDILAQLTDTPDEQRRFAKLQQITADLRSVLAPWGSAREDWEYGVHNLGAAAGLADTMGRALTSWRTMLPPVAARAMAEAFLENGASIWVLRTHQVGGDDPDIEPLVPNI